MARSEELLISRSRTLRSRRAEAARSFKWSSLDFPGGGWSRAALVGDWGCEGGRTEAVGGGGLGWGDESGLGCNGVIEEGGFGCSNTGELCASGGVFGRSVMGGFLMSNVGGFL